MYGPTGTTDPNLLALLIQLRKQSNESKAPIWKTIARLLRRSRRQRIVTNVSKLNQVTKPNDIVVIPGKLLGAGEIDHAITVSAWDFSEQARRKITGAGGRFISIMEMVEQYPQGKNVRIIA